jgi:hypothetical protein
MAYRELSSSSRQAAALDRSEIPELAESVNSGNKAFNVVEEPSVRSAVAAQLPEAAAGWLPAQEAGEWET